MWIMLLVQSCRQQLARYQLPFSRKVNEKGYTLRILRQERLECLFHQSDGRIRLAAHCSQVPTDFVAELTRTCLPFSIPFVVHRERSLRVDIDAGLKFLGPVYFVKHEAIFAQEVPDPQVVLRKRRTCRFFLSSISRSIFYLQRRKGSELCLSEGSLVLKLSRQDAGLEYWQAAFETKMAVICFEGHGWGKAHHWGELQSTGDTV